MIRIFLILISVSLFLSSCMENIITTNTGESNTTPSLYATGLTDDEKIQLARDRKKEVRTIRKGDYMTLKNNPQQAISYYESALEKLPHDIVIRRKIAHAYYQIRNWKEAYNNYVQVPISELKENEYNELFRSLFFDNTRPDRLTELARYQIDQSTRDYYQMIDTCYSGIHNCILFIEGYTGSSTQIHGLRHTIDQSQEISSDYQYRNFLVATELYRQGSYLAVEKLTTEILQKRPNYTEVKKLSGFALYELGRYSEARDILLVYLEANPNDIETISRLGDIYMYLDDYTTSSLYLNNALKAGYTHKTEIERRLAYNYAAIGDHTSMLKVLTYLLQESDVNEDDYAVAISLALREGENMRAYAWSYAGIKRYPNSALLTPLYISAMRLNGRSTEIPDYIHTLTDELAKNPIIQLEYAISMLDAGNRDQALPIFTAIRDQDPATDWGIEAGNAIQQITMWQDQTGSIQ